ncbi:MAG: LysM domain-containing protein, partial [Anaerolineales bacterium]
AAGADQPTPEAKTNTPTPTNTQGPTSTPTITTTPTNTLAPVDCGPPLGWVLHTVQVGETLDSLSALYRVDEADIRKANCRGEMTFIVPGEKLYVPNVATSTPTNTPTPTPEHTATNTPNVGQTQTVAAGGPTATATNSPTTLSSPVGPDNKTISSLDACTFSYRIKAVDPDGIADVKLIWTFDGSLPKRDTAISDGHYKTLSLLSNDVYSVSQYLIDTTGQSIPVHIRFRFAALDTLDNLSYYPANDAYDLTDTVNCGKTVGTVNSAPVNPITDLANCTQLYSVTATDGNGVSEVMVLYTLDDGSTTGSGSFPLPLDSGDTYLDNVLIDTAGYLQPVTVEYKFQVKDTLGNLAQIGSGSYVDEVNCTP